MKGTLALVLVWATVVFTQELVPADVPVDERPLVRCRRPICDDETMECPHGRQKDSHGCDTCRCACPDITSCAWCSGPRLRDAAGCEICACATVNITRPIPEDIEPGIQKCMPLGCNQFCEFGFETDENGCETCTCKQDPCQEYECGDEEVCRSVRPTCLDPDAPCPTTSPVCVPKPLCERRQGMHEHMQHVMGGMSPLSMKIHRQMMFSPECEPDSGLFKPRQCHGMLRQCWCVDDRGEEMDDTRHLMNDLKSVMCEHNLTQSAYVSFNMMPDIGSMLSEMEDDMIDELKGTVQSQLTEWLRLGEEYIDSMDLRLGESNEMVIVEFIIQRPDPEDLTDLASSLYHLRYHIHRPDCSLEYHGHRLQPDPASVTIHHSYGNQPAIPQPRLPTNGGLKDGRDHGRWGRFCHTHPKATVAGLIAGTILIVGLIVLLALSFKKKKRSYLAKRETYKQNLAFANDLYDVNKMTEDEKQASVLIQGPNEPSVA